MAVVEERFRVKLGTSKALKSVALVMEGLMYSPLLTVELAALSFKAMPWTVKAAAVVVALTPATAPSSTSRPVERLEDVVHLATRPLLPAPVSPLPAAAMVICPTVLVVMVMLEPLIRVIGAYLTPLESAPKSWPCWVGRVDVPVPPLATESCPVKPGTKVKVLAVVVWMLTVMLASEVVATWMAGPVKAEMEVRAEVK